jgi:hypothetical protein
MQRSAVLIDRSGPLRTAFAMATGESAKVAPMGRGWRDQCPDTREQRPLGKRFGAREAAAAVMGDVAKGLNPAEVRKQAAAAERSAGKRFAETDLFGSRRNSSGRAKYSIDDSEPRQIVIRDLVIIGR